MNYERASPAADVLIRFPQQQCLVPTKGPLLVVMMSVVRVVRHWDFLTFNAARNLPATRTRSGLGVQRFLESILIQSSAVNFIAYPPSCLLVATSP